MCHFRRNGIVCILILLGISPLGCGACDHEDDRPGAVSSGESNAAPSGPPSERKVFKGDLWGGVLTRVIQREVYEPFDIRTEVESSLMWTTLYVRPSPPETQAMSIVLVRGGGPYEAKTMEKQWKKPRDELLLRLTRVQTECVTGTLAFVTTVRLVDGRPTIDEAHFSYTDDSGWIESDISVQPLVIRPPDDGH